MNSVDKDDWIRPATTVPTTIQELVDRYCEECVLRPASRSVYQTAAGIFVRDTGITALDAVKLEDVLVWRKTVIDRCSYTSWNSYRRAVKTLFNFALRRGWLKGNPFLDVKPLACGARKKTVAKSVMAEALDILNSKQTPVSPGWFWVAAFRLLFFSGMRRRQLAELRWRDLDFDRADRKSVV